MLNLISLDVSKNTMLTNIQCNDNKFSTSVLNFLFETLHNNPGNKTIYIGGNPGTNYCDRSIAEGKGWTVSD